MRIMKGDEIWEKRSVGIKIIGHTKLNDTIFSFLKGLILLSKISDKDKKIKFHWKFEAEKR